MAYALVISRVYSFAAHADTFTSADLTSAFAGEFAGDDVLGAMPLQRCVHDALRCLLAERVIEDAAPGVYRMGRLVSE